MSTLAYLEKRKLEKLFGMSSGYVFNYSDRTFGNLIADIAGLDIHAEKFCSRGSSERSAGNDLDSDRPDHLRQLSRPEGLPTKG